MKMPTVKELVTEVLAAEAITIKPHRTKFPFLEVWRVVVTTCGGIQFFQLRFAACPTQEDVKKSWEEFVPDLAKAIRKSSLDMQLVMNKASWWPLGVN